MESNLGNKNTRFLPSQELTKAEEEIMQWLWQLEEANVAQIIDKMPSPKPAYNTVSTIVRILETKGFVDYKKMGRGHIYFPLVEKETYTKATMNKLMNNYFNGSIKSMLSFFVKKNELSVQELEEILKEIDKKES
ncbi:MAG TPA: BlaI/MecI/CopY family transcriptional regulator [Flavobacteriaceae bacterium]|nr:BlaI/MecI/CopY family transcriptional regulator [Flavobacteriaceae bacterium]